MRDKKLPPDEPNAAWDDPGPDGGHNKTYYADAQAEEEDEIKPIDEPAAAAPPKSQALMDIQEAGLTPEEAARASEELAAAQAAPEKPAGKKADRKAEKAPKKAADRSGTQNLAVIARFRWIFLLVLSLISVAAWTAEAFLSDRPYNWEAAAWLALTLVFVLPTLKFLRLPTISGLAALFWAGSYLISALHGPPETLFDFLPAALCWAGLLSLIFLWAGVAIWRKLGRYRVIDLVLSLVLIYAALGPISALVSSISSGAALSLNFSVLGSSPAFLTDHLNLPWFIWPMTIFIAVVLPLCALFSLWDQFSAFRRRGARHGGNFFLALAFIVLLPYAFLSYDQAVSNCPQVAEEIRSVWPAATQYAQESQTPAPSSPVPPAADTPAPAPSTEPAPVQLAEPVPAPAPVTVPEEEEVALPTIPPEPKVVEAESPPPASPPAAPEPTAQSQTPPAQPQQAEEAAPAQAPVSTAPPTLEERLAASDRRLDEALSRITELERELNLLKKSALENQPAAPPAPAAPDAENAEEPYMDFFIEGDT